jgi:hypothetical protein
MQQQESVGSESINRVRDDVSERGLLDQTVQRGRSLTRFAGGMYIIEPARSFRCRRRLGIVAS